MTKGSTEPEMTRGQKAAATRKRNAEAKAKAEWETPVEDVSIGVPLSYLAEALSSLDEAAETLQGYATIKSATAVLEIEHNGRVVTLATKHNGSEWSLEQITNKA